MDAWIRRQLTAWAEWEDRRIDQCVLRAVYRAQNQLGYRMERASGDELLRLQREWQRCELLRDRLTRRAAS
jgi:hypothetical protein